MNARVPAEIFPPGEFLREELEARGWSQQELADILSRPPRVISEIIAGKRAITPETALGLAEAFGTSPDYWMNLESQYQLSKVKNPGNHVARMARIYSNFPAREMIRRGWIQATESVEVLEQRFCEFFQISDPDQPPKLVHAAKKSDPLTESNRLQLAWLFRVRAMAKQQQVPRYSKARLEATLDGLKALTSAPEEARHVPRIVGEAGVRFVIVEPLAGSKIDGACLWLSDDKPVIGMTLRFDRIDNFWFVLRHELEHVLRGDGRDVPVVDDDVDEAVEGLPEREIAANSAAAEFCVAQKELEFFIARVQPYFSEAKVLGFAERLKTHPGIVVGQLQRRLKRHDFLRKYQVKIRKCVVPSADVDGWGTVS